MGDSGEKCVCKPSFALEAPSPLPFFFSPPPSPSPPPHSAGPPRARPPLARPVRPGGARRVCRPPGAPPGPPGGGRQGPDSRPPACALICSSPGDPRPGGSRPAGRVSPAYIFWREGRAYCAPTLAGALPQKGEGRGPCARAQGHTPDKKRGALPFFAARFFAARTWGRCDTTPPRRDPPGGAMEARVRRAGVRCTQLEVHTREGSANAEGHAPPPSDPLVVLFLRSLLSAAALKHSHTHTHTNGSLSLSPPLPPPLPTASSPSSSAPPPPPRSSPWSTSPPGTR